MFCHFLDFCFLFFNGMENGDFAQAAASKHVAVDYWFYGNY